MKQGQIDALFRMFQHDETELQRRKCADYADVENDVLSNFKEAGREADIHTLQAWFTYWYKHYTAIRSFVRGHHNQTDSLYERIRDLRIYLVLLYALAIDVGALNEEVPLLNVKNERAERYGYETKEGCDG